MWLESNGLDLSGAFILSDGAEDLLASFFILLLAWDLLVSLLLTRMLFILYEKVENGDGAAVSGMEFCPGAVK